MTGTLQDIADRQAHTTLTTAGWIMPALPEDKSIVLAIRSRDWIAAEAMRRGLPDHTAGFAVPGVGVFVPPLNTVGDMELWRHELRHAIEGDWHGRDALADEKRPSAAGLAGRPMREAGASHLTPRCRKKLEGVHADLTRVIERASRDASVSFIVTCGLRTQEEQRKLYDMGKTRTMKSRHLTGHAVDLAVVEDGAVTWSWTAYEKLAQTIKHAAGIEGVRVVWGGDWKDFRDGPHFELA